MAGRGEKTNAKLRPKPGSGCSAMDGWMDGINDKTKLQEKGNRKQKTKKSRLKNMNLRVVEVFCTR
jgi:hypothetical protein